MRNSQSDVFYYVESGVCYNVVEGKNSIGTVITGEQTHGRLAGNLKVYFVTNHQRTVYFYAVLAQRLKISMLATAHHIKMIRTSYKCNTPASGVYKMTCSKPCRLISICSNRREQVGKTRPGKKDKRYAHAVDILKVSIIYCILRQTRYYPLHVHTDKVVYGTLLTLMIFMAVYHHNRISLLCGIVFYAVHHRRIIMGNKVGHHNTDYSRCFFSQTLCKRIRSIVQFLCKFLHAPFHIVTNFMTVSQRP